MRNSAGYLVAIVLSTACVGQVDAGPARTRGGAVGTCEEGDLPPVRNLRLSRAHYVSALEAAFGSDVVGAASVSNALAALPATQSGRFSGEPPPPSYSEVEAYVDVASAIGYTIGDDPGRLSALDGCLTEIDGAVDPMTNACLGGLVDRLGRILLRRPIAAAERQRALEGYTIGGSVGGGEGVATLLTTMLVEPAFLYFLEIDGAEVTPGVLELTPYEVAARMARVLWRSVPDAELMDAADAGLSEEMLVAQLERMWADPRARNGMETFYVEWLGLDALPYPSASLIPDAERDAFRTDMRSELVAFANSITFERNGGYRELLLDRTTFVTTDSLASVYDLPPGTRGEAVLPAETRAGILTRAGWLATTEVPRSNAGHLIKRGARLARFVCRDLPPPDPSLFPAENPTNPGTGTPRTLRQRFRDATAESTCAGCHRTLDTLGGPFGHYGAVGEWVDLETIESETSTLSLDIDSTGTTPYGDEVDDAVAMSEELAASAAGANCFASQLARYALARAPSGGDACLTQRLAEVLWAPGAEAGSVREAIFAMMLSTEWRRAALP